MSIRKHTRGLIEEERIKAARRIDTRADYLLDLVLERGMSLTDLLNSTYEIKIKVKVINELIHYHMIRNEIGEATNLRYILRDLKNG